MGYIACRVVLTVAEQVIRPIALTAVLSAVSTVVMYVVWHAKWPVVRRAVYRIPGLVLTSVFALICSSQPPGT